MKTRITRVLMAALIAASILISGTAYAAATEPGGDSHARNTITTSP